MFHQSNEAKESVLTQCRCVHRGGWFWVQSLNCWSYLACGHEEGEDEDKGALGHWQPVGLLHGEEDGTVEAGFGWAVERKKTNKKHKLVVKRTLAAKTESRKGWSGGWRKACYLIWIQLLFDTVSGCFLLLRYFTRGHLSRLEHIFDLAQVLRPDCIFIQAWGSH